VFITTPNLHPIAADHIIYYQQSALVDRYAYTFRYISDYNIALDKRTFLLASQTLGPFADGLHADVSLFMCTFSRQLYLSMPLFENIILISFALNMERSNNSFGDEEDTSCELPNFQHKFYLGPPPKRLLITFEASVASNR